ncbi:MAG TPA: hypothetical protein VFV02_16010, partial [Acidimicrobiales bacterium]|nr:hypothetical protein [Acidimicrobiales bacterium]
MRTGPAKPLIISLALAGLVALAAGPALASTWVAHLAAGSSGESQATTLPAAPTGVAAACQSSTGSRIIVSWTTVPKATTYTVFDSTTSATSGYSVLASGVTTTPWTSGSLSANHYWFEVS